jgi:small subunit ribosomal protein S2
LAEKQHRRIESMTENKTGMPVKQEVFLEAGVHIGTKIRTSDMREFIFKRRDDGLYILDLRKSSETLMQAAKVISKYRPEEVTVVASRVYSSNPATRFAELTGVNLIKGRFVPGTMTNMNVKGFMEPKLILVCDPKGEHEALVESAKNGVPVIGLCDTDNETKFIDLIVPINNKGKRSLALIFFILSREVMIAQGKIKAYDEFTYDLGFFEQQILAEEKAEGEAEGPAEAAQPEAAPAPEPAEAKPPEPPEAKPAEAEQQEKKEEPAPEKPKKAKKAKEEKDEGKEE